MRLKIFLVILACAGFSFAAFSQTSDAEAEAIVNLLGVQKKEAIGKLVAVFERAGFETGAIGAMDVVNIETLRRIFRNNVFSDAHCLVSRIVEHLDLEFLARVVDCGDSFEQSIYDVQLVEKR